MKNLVKILGSTLISFSVVPAIFQTTNSEIQPYLDLNYQLRSVPQKNANYAIPALMESIFDFFDVPIASRYDFNQERIYDDLYQQNPNSPNIKLSQYVANYLSVNINSNSSNVVRYDYNHVDSRFGTNNKELEIFQKYIIKNFTEHRQPVIVHSENTSILKSPNIVITGIATNVDPGKTIYRYMDSVEGKFYTVSGNFISLISAKGLEIMGYGQMLDKENAEWVDVNISYANREIGELLNQDELKRVQAISIDLTETIGINSLLDFSNEYYKVSLKNFNGNIYKFNGIRYVTGKDFYISTDSLPKHDIDLSWNGQIREIASASEDSGSAHIDGRIAAQLNFRRNLQRHLVMILTIYVAGRSWSTGNWAHVWFMVGDELRLSKRG